MTPSIILHRHVPSLFTPTDGSPIRRVLTEHTRRFLVQDVEAPQQRINVRRSNLLEDALCQFRRHNLDVERRFSVRFLGEPAVDTGGPRREFFRLFLQEMKTTACLFEETQDGLIFAHNVAALSHGDFRIIGKILALSILLGGSPPACFIPPVADEIVYGEVKCSLPTTLISDSDIVDKLLQVCYLATVLH